MASSPSSRRTLYTNNRDFPGCMGGLMHLFDFNQALAGRKLLTDKKSGAGLEAPRNSLDVGGSIPEALKSNVERSEEVLHGYELQKASAPKRLNGMPMKALIAQELSKESDTKNRAPSVVARLMGLDALPTDSKVLQKPLAGSMLGKIDEKFTQRSVVERQRHEEVTPHNVRLYAKKAKASVVSGQISSRSSHAQRSDSQDGKSGSDSLPLRSHPQEQQLQEFKKEFEAWQSQKSWGHSKRSSRLDDTQTHMPSQQRFLREKRPDSNLALPRESFSNAMLNASQERLHESREFQDALDFLQSNKEFFMRFLHEPNSLFARHLQDNESDSLSPPQAIEGSKHRRPHQASDASEGSRPQSWVKDSLVSKRYHKSDGRDESRPLSWVKESPISRSPRGDVMVDRSVLSMPHSPFISSEESLGRQDRYRHAFSPMASENRLHNTDCHIPTRIVVLKPSPGRVRNLKSVSPIYCRSPKDHTANDAFREDSTDVLERLREKLRKDSGREFKHERRGMGLNINEQYRDATKDPREIAREIARQVRENITRDLMVDPRCLSNVHSSARDTSLGRRPMQASDSQNIAGRDAEACVSTTSKPYRDNHTRSTCVPLHLDKKSDLETLHGSTEEKVNIFEQVQRKSTRVSDESMSQGHDLDLKNGVFIKESNSHSQFSLGPKVSRSSKGSGRYNLDGSYLDKPHHRSLFHNPTGQAEDPSKRGPAFELEHFAHGECAEKNKDGCQSLSLATPGDDIMAELEMDRGAYLKDLAAEVGCEMVAHNSVVHLTSPNDVDAHPVDLATNSSFGVQVMDVNKSLATEEVKQTIVMLEDCSGSQPFEEVAAANTKEHQQSDGGESSVLNHEFPASLHVCSGAFSSVEDSTSINSFLSHKHGTLLHANDSALEVLLESKGQEAESSCNAQTMKVVYPNNDAQVPLDNIASSPSSVHTSCCELPANFVTEPVKEQPEQPSPISVLDLPFQDESSVATEFKELSSDLEELRMRLRLLKLDNGDNDIDNDDDFESEPDAGMHPGKIRIVEEGFVDHLQMDEGDCNTFYDVEEMGKESEMLYVKDVLVASGFTGDSSTILTCWYAPGQPLNPCLLQKMESNFCDHEKEIQELNETAFTLGKQGAFNVSRRHLLFDCVNEVLLDVLGPHFNRQLWLSSLKLTSCLPTGKDLIKLVWSHVWCSLCSHSGSQETLENLVTKDLGKGSRWIDTGYEIEAAGLDVERAILDDLIEETLLVL
eukprot:c22333_g1_i1 orf=607-4302(+)